MSKNITHIQKNICQEKQCSKVLEYSSRKYSERVFYTFGTRSELGIFYQLLESQFRVTSSDENV